MKLRTVKSAVLIMSILASAVTFAATKNDSSDFSLKLFNSTSANQPLHYTIIRTGQASIDGEMAAGGDSGIITVDDVGSTGQSHAEIIVKDAAGHTIWDTTATFWGKGPDFYTNTVSLDSHYHVSTHAFPSTRMVGFDIQGSS